MKRNRKIRGISMVLALAVLLSVAMPQSVLAKSSKKVKNPAMVTLKANKTYTKYDITGDGKADKIKISTGKAYYDVYEKLTVTVNGKKVLCDKSSYFRVEAKLCTLKNGKVFLYLYNPFQNYDATVCGLYRYQNGKLVQSVDLLQVCGVGDTGYHTYGDVLSVKGNKITLQSYQINYQMGALVTAFEYTYSKGKLIPDNKAKVFTVWSAKYNNGKLTAAYKINVYKKTDCKTKAFTLKKNQKIVGTGIYCKSGKMFAKVKRLSDGKFGYIKCINDYPFKKGEPFKEIVYGG